MADLARIKRNIAKMVSQSAPEADIDAYIASEGVTLDQVRQYKLGESVHWQGRERTNDAQVQPQNGSEFHNPLDRFNAVGNAAAEATPFFGPQMADWGRGVDAWLENNVYAPLTGNTPNANPESIAEYNQQNAAANPAADVTGKIVGNVAPFLAGGEIPVVARGLGMAATNVAGKAIPLLERMAASGASMFGINTADQVARGKSLPEAAQESLTPAGIASAVPALGAVVRGTGRAVSDMWTKGAQASATKAAVKAAPSAAELQQASRDMFRAVDNAGVTVDPKGFSDFAARVITNANKMRMNPTLDPKAVGAFQEMASMATEALQGGKVTLSDLHTLRQIAQKAAQSSEGRDAMFANTIVNGLDDFIKSGKGLVTPPGSKDAGNQLLNAISTWGRSKRVGLVEEAIYRAQNVASGVENGLRTEFRKLLQNKNTRALFTPAEIQAIETVANGGTVANLLKLAGKFGFDKSNMVGGTIGVGLGTKFGGPLGGAIAGVLAHLARRGSQVMTENAANTASKVMATPNIPIVPQAPNLLAPPATLVELLGRGAASAQ